MADRYCGCPNQDKCYGGTENILCKFEEFMAGRLADWTSPTSQIIREEKEDQE